MKGWEALASACEASASLSPLGLCFKTATPWNHYFRSKRIWQACQTYVGILIIVLYHLIVWSWLGFFIATVLSFQNDQFQDKT